MNNTSLIQNVRWLGKSNDLIDLLGGEDNEDASCDNIDDTTKDGEMRPIIIGRGIAKKDKSDNVLSKENYMGPSRNDQYVEQLDVTWAKFRSHLGHMLRNYRHQYRNLRADQQRELGHFFNMASNMLDTIGRMTENAT